MSTETTDTSDTAAAAGTGPTGGKPIVWAVCEGVWPSGDQAWAAYTDDARQITGHLSSSRQWGIHDVGPGEFKSDRYLAVVGTNDPAEIDYRVIEHGQWLPDDVVERGLAAGHLERRTDDETPDTDGG